MEMNYEEIDELIISWLRGHCRERRERLEGPRGRFKWIREWESERERIRQLLRDFRERRRGDVLPAIAPVRSTIGAFNEIMSAEASSGLTILGAGGGDAPRVQLNGGTALRSTARTRGHGGRFLPTHIIYPPQQGDQGLVAAALKAEDMQRHKRRERRREEPDIAPVRSTIEVVNEIMSAEASSGLTFVGGRGGADALGVQLNGGMLSAPHSTARTREHVGSQDFLVDEAGGRFIAIHIIYPPQQGGQGLVAAARRAEDGPGDLAQRALQSAIGGLVPLCFTLLLDDNIIKDSSPGYIKPAAYAGLWLVTGFTFIGLASKKRANAAARLLGSTTMAAASIVIVHKVSADVYIRSICGIIGAVATLATMAIDW